MADRAPASSTSCPNSLTTQAVWFRLGQSLRGYFGRRLADPEAVEDLTQETFLRVHRALPTLHDHERVGAWVFRIARHVLIDHLRRRRRVASLGDVEPEATQRGDPHLDSGLGRCLLAALDDLPSEYREALETVELGGQTQRAYAESAGLSLSGAKSRVQRGRVRLRESLEKCCRFEFDPQQTLTCEPRGGVCAHCPTGQD